jgi:hypothetical protein
MNFWDIAIAAAVVAAMIIAVRRIRKNKGRCSCGCSGCAASETCRRQSKDQ